MRKRKQCVSIPKCIFLKPLLPYMAFMMPTWRIVRLSRKWRRMLPVTLKAAIWPDSIPTVSTYRLEDAHTAEADTRATYEVLKAQLDRYPDLQNDIAFLAEYSSFSKNVDFAGRMVYDDNGVEVFNFGKYKGMSVAEVLKKDPGYYSWILNSDFTLNTKAVLTKIRLREMSNLITK